MTTTTHTETIIEIEKDYKRPVIVSDFKQEIISKGRRDIKIKLEDLYHITQDSKTLLDYDSLDNGTKYILEKYQDTILYYAENYKLD